MPPATQANLRSVFHDFKACATLRILHFYLELRLVALLIDFISMNSFLYYFTLLFNRNMV